jgi:hypothetical protein
MSELTVAYKFFYSNYDDNADYDENKFVAEYYKELSKRNNVDAIIISTGYLDCLTLANLKELGVTAILEQGSIVVTSGNTENFYEVFNDEEIEGLVFKTTRAVDALKLIRKLGDLRYCLECGMRNIDKLIWYNVDEKTILYVSIDTVSV